MYCKREVSCVFEDRTARFGDAVHVLVLAAGEASHTPCTDALRELR